MPAHGTATRSVGLLTASPTSVDYRLSIRNTDQSSRRKWGSFWSTVGVRRRWWTSAEVRDFRNFFLRFARFWAGLNPHFKLPLLLPRRSFTPTF